MSRRKWWIMTIETLLICLALTVMLAGCVDILVNG